MKLSLRLRLTLWYTAILALSLAFFGFLNYETVSKDLQKNLDTSIEKVAESLEYYIVQRLEETNQTLSTSAPRRAADDNDADADNIPDPLGFLNEVEIPLRDFEGPVLPEPDTLKAEPEVKPGLVWSAVYEHILLNQQNYFIQVADTAGTIIWRSENLGADSLPLPAHLIRKLDAIPHSEVRSKYDIGGKKLRVLLYYTSAAQITVAYPVEEIQATLNDLFSSLIIAVPGVLLISTLGGWFLAKYSLQPIEDINRSAKEITASNLSLRLPVPVVNDEIARLTETLNEMISRLEASFQQIRQFTGDASHELRTPLAILMGELEIALRSKRSPAEYEDILISAQEEVIRLSKVVENLLQLSRADSGEVQLDLEDIDLADLVGDIYEDAIVLSEERGITVHFAGERSVMINGDKVRLHQAVLNVVDNAIKYTPDRRDIYITLRRNAHNAIIAVRDTGVGIAKADLKNIFNRFYRVDKARSQNVRGHGLGLSIVKSIIVAHRGSINIDSEEDRGTTFTIRLPLNKHSSASNGKGREIRSPYSHA